MFESPKGPKACRLAQRKLGRLLSPAGFGFAACSCRGNDVLLVAVTKSACFFLHLAYLPAVSPGYVDSQRKHLTWSANCQTCYHFGWFWMILDDFGWFWMVNLWWISYRSRGHWTWGAFLSSSSGSRCLAAEAGGTPAGHRQFAGRDGMIGIHHKPSMCMLINIINVCMLQNFLELHRCVKNCSDNSLKTLPTSQAQASQAAPVVETISPYRAASAELNQLRHEETKMVVVG